MKNKIGIIILFVIQAFAIPFALLAGLMSKNHFKTQLQFDYITPKFKTHYQTTKKVPFGTLDLY